MTLRVGIAGLGRVGRGLFRTNFSQVEGGRFDICVLCDVMPIDQAAYLLANDSTYGKPPFPLDCDGSHLILGDKKVRYLSVDRRREVPQMDNNKVLREFELDAFVDATGTATIADLREILEQRIARKVISTSNVEGCDISLVYGVNNDSYHPARHHVITASTCTGNAMVPVAYILDKHFGIDYARIITIHPALSDQRVLDGFHATSQLGRACASSILPVSTNVAKSTALVLSQLEGKLDSISYRVPTEIVSVLDFTANLARKTSRDECAELFESYSNSSLKGIIHCEYGAWGHERASIDFLGTEYSSIILMKHLVVSNGKQIGISIMHDNERGYCCRALDILSLIQQKAA